MQDIENTDEWVNWIEEAIVKKYFKYYEYEHFINIQEIGTGGFGKVSRANWKNSEQYLALKSFFNINNITVKEVVRELQLHRDVDFHNNVIRFYGITKFGSENQNNKLKNYMLVMEYANGGTLRNYLKMNFNNLSWENKLSLAYQLACAVSCLHDEGIVHRDLHPFNVLVHQNNIKLADFGLSKRIKEASNPQSKLFGIIPYIDPKRFSMQRDSDNIMQSYSLNLKSDVYSVGVLLWEISSGVSPFFTEESNDIGLINEISQGLREKPISGTPNDYIKIYTECWDGDPENRPSMYEVVGSLRAIISQSNTTIYYQQNDIYDQISNESPTYNSDESSKFSQMIQNFDMMTTREIEPTTSSKIILSENNFGIIVNEIVEFILNDLNKGNECNVLNYFNNYNINSQEIYNLLLANQNNADSIFLLGYFKLYGIETSTSYDIAFHLFIIASGQNHILAQFYVGLCYEFGYGITKNEEFDFKYFETLANKNCAAAQFNVGYHYNYGIGVRKDIILAIYWYEKAAKNGNLIAMLNLATIYQDGIGIDKDDQKAFELLKQSAEGELPGGILALGYCHEIGIGTDINKQKAFELYQKAANLGSMIAQYNLAEMYKNGEGIEKDIDQAIYWYEQSANQGDQNSQKKLNKLRKNSDSCRIF